MSTIVGITHRLTWPSPSAASAYQPATVRGLPIHRHLHLRPLQPLCSPSTAPVVFQQLSSGATSHSTRYHSQPISISSRQHCFPSWASDRVLHGLQDTQEQTKIIHPAFYEALQQFRVYLTNLLQDRQHRLAFGSLLFSENYLVFKSFFGSPSSAVPQIPIFNSITQSLPHDLQIRHVFQRSHQRAERCCRRRK